MNTINTENQTLDFGTGGGTIQTLESFLPDNEIITDVEEVVDTTLEDIIVPEEITIDSGTPIELESIGTSSPYKEMIDRMVKLGEWQPLDVIEDEEGNEIPYEEAEIDEETFAQIAKFQTQTKQEALLAIKIDVDKTSDFTRKLIEIEKNGGNIRQALDAYDRVISPLETLDTSTEEGQAQILEMKYRAQGLQDDVISTVIQGFLDKGVLETKAEEAKDEFKTAFDKHVESINEQALAAKDEEVKALAAYRKELKQNLTKFEINEATQKRLLDAASKKGEGGYEVDAIYNTKRRDPKEADELTFFLINKEEYLKQKFKDLSRAKDLDVLNKFKFIKKSGDSVRLANQDTKDKKEISLDEI